MTESFRKLGLSESMLRIIAEAEFIDPSEIQEKTIPLALAGKDVIGGSATGSGKTLAFGASIIEHAVKGKGIQALILTPTRELAEQIGKVLKKFSHYKGLSVGVVYGGVGINPQIHALQHADIVVGTPGRILDHMERRTIILQNIKTLVLDEADRMLDMGFIDDVRKIIERCPKERQTMLFSATISSDITHLAKQYMRNPIEIAVESYVDASLLEQVYYDVQQNQKLSLLVHLLKHETSHLVMVFCNTRRNTDFVSRNLHHEGIDTMAIHGGLSQDKRNRIMEKFHSSKVYVLVCTDVAARGLDIKGVSHVYNYDIPPTSKEYIHRIGRTARAGKEGKALSIVSPRDYDNFRSVLRNPDLKIKQETLPTDIAAVHVKVLDGEQTGYGGSFVQRGRNQYRRGFGGERSKFGGRRGQERRGFGGPRREFGGGGHSGERSSNKSFAGRGRSFNSRDRSRSFGRGREGSSGRFNRGSAHEGRRGFGRKNFDRSR